MISTIRKRLIQKKSGFQKKKVFECRCGLKRQTERNLRDFFCEGLGVNPEFSGCGIDGRRVR